MIRRNKIIASVAVSVMTGVLVAGNLAPLQGYYAFAQETGVKTARYSAVKDINKTLEGYTPMDSSDPVEFGGTYIKYQGETIQLSETAIYVDGRTGEVKKRAKAPFSTPEEDGTIIGVPDKIYAFDRINPDGMRICNFRGLDKPRDILIKDRYCRVYALNDDLEVMWHFQSDKNTGHFPFAIDINGDGHDELLVGYNMLDCHGNKMWTMPVNEDHIDEIVPGRFESGPHKGTKFFACVAGKEGFLISDFNGKLLKKDGIGHTQRVSLANYLPNRPGYEMVVVNFWGHQGIIYFYDSEGNQLWEMENELNGNLLTPVNWTGDGQDFILLNADIERGGMIDGNGIQVVKFPDDGHPTMCAEAVNLYGDARDEIVTWDYDSMYIYTQDDAPKDDVYAPFKYPDYNASNYRGEYSYREKWW